MEIIVSSLVAVSCAVLVLIHAWKFLNWVWFIPKKMEKSLRQQGFNGNPYKLLFGDFKDVVNMMREAKSKPMNFSNDIVQRVTPFIHKTVNNYGQNCFLWFGPKPSAIIFNPEHIREIFSKSYVFQKPHNPMSKYVLSGLVTYETDKWAKHRRLINPVFHLDKLMHMVPSFELSCSEMLKKWEDMIGNEGWCELDVWPYLQGLTSDAISRTAFGSSFEEGRKIFELQKKQTEILVTSPLSVYIPFWRFLPTKSNRMMKRNLKELDSLVLQLINKRMKAMETGETSDDLLGLLLESNLKEIQQEGNKFGMSLQEVIEECKLFYIAGQETTSALLVWTMILLSKHEDWQTRARQEVLQVCSKPKPDFQELNQLRIVTMIIYEALRLYPPGIMFSRVIHKETKLGKDLILPAGLQLLLPTIILHHDPKIWGNDAKEFNPYRFSEGISKTTQGQLSYYPFGWGPRICTGQNFAMLEAKMALAMILQTYSFKLSSSYSHAPHLLLTLQPQHGAHLILHKL